MPITLIIANGIAGYKVVIGQVELNAYLILDYSVILNPVILCIP